jgi:hypothetical protein
MTSETAVEDAVQDGVAQLIDTNFYFLCEVVSPNAGK